MPPSLNFINFFCRGEDLDLEVAHFGQLVQDSLNYSGVENALMKQLQENKRIEDYLRGKVSQINVNDSMDYNWDADSAFHSDSPRKSDALKKLANYQEFKGIDLGLGLSSQKLVNSKFGEKPKLSSHSRQDSFNSKLSLNGSDYQR